MSKTLEIMLDDLGSKAQKRVLAFFGCDSAAEGNLDVVPLFVLERGEGSDR